MCVDGDANDVGVVPKARAMCAHGPRSLKKEKKRPGVVWLAATRWDIRQREPALCFVSSVDRGKGQSSRFEEGRGRANGRGGEWGRLFVCCRGGACSRHRSQTKKSPMGNNDDGIDCWEDVYVGRGLQRLRYAKGESSARMQSDDGRCATRKTINPAAAGWFEAKTRGWGAHTTFV